MRLVFSFVLVLGLALAGFAVYMAKDYIGAYQAELAAEKAASAQLVPTKDVYVASRVLAYGEALAIEDVVVVKWPENALPEGVFFTKEELFPNENKDARIILRKMEKNEPILAVKVTEPGKDAGVSSRLAAGMRAFAIKVDVSTGVSGFLRPSDYVDVYWTGRSYSNGNASTGEVTKLIQASIQIIAVDQQADGENKNPSIARTITVTVSPNQVAALAQAQSTGRLSLSLVGVNEENKAADVEINQQQLLGIADSEAPAPIEVARVCTIKTRKGAETVETQIPCTN